MAKWKRWGMILCCALSLILCLTACDRDTEQGEAMTQNGAQTQTTTPTNVGAQEGNQNIKSTFLSQDFNVKIEDQKSYLLELSVDLNQDREPDGLSVFLECADPLNRASYIKVNGVKHDIEMMKYEFSFGGKVYIADLDKKDKYLEVAIFDEGPSGDPQYHFFRYVGNTICYLGSLDSGCEITPQGALLPSLCRAKLSPSFHSASIKIENNRFELVPEDVSGCLGKTYGFSGTAYFTPSEKMTQDVDWSKPMEFGDQTVKLIDVGIGADRILESYLVEFPDGKKGTLFFWLGD